MFWSKLLVCFCIRSKSVEAGYFCRSCGSSERRARSPSRSRPSVVGGTPSTITTVKSCTLKPAINWWGNVIQSGNVPSVQGRWCRSCRRWWWRPTRARSRSWWGARSGEGTERPCLSLTLSTISLQLIFVFPMIFDFNFCDWMKLWLSVCSDYSCSGELDSLLMDVFFSGCWSCRQVLREKSKPMCRVKLFFFFADSVESRISPAGEERGVCFHPQVTAVAGTK